MAQKLKNPFLLAIFQFWMLAAYAQLPHNILLPEQVQSRAYSNCNNLPGELSFGLINGQTTQYSLDEIVLCYGDSIELININSNLSDDPNTNTQSGIGYALFTCPPIGSSIIYHLDSIIARQTCLNTSANYYIPNAPAQNLTGPFWIFTDQPSGDLLLYNQGQLQYGFNNGQPISVWLAPITLDNFSDRSFENGGSCAALDPTEAIKVTYLNPIQAQEVTPPASGNECQSAWAITGGNPELNSGQNYSINIYLDNPQKTPVIPDNYVTHGDTLTFQVPKPGNYILEISDGISCEQRILVNKLSCPALDIVLPSGNAPKDSIICIPIAVSNFSEVNSIQLPIAWDTNILEYQSIDLGSNPLNMVDKLFTQDSNTKTLLMSWDNSSGIYNIPDGTAIFNICFKVIGSLGSCTPIYVPDVVNGIPPFFPEITNTQTQIIGWSANEGEICVSDNPIYIQTTIDTLTCGDHQPGNVQLTVKGDNPPYNIYLTDLISNTILWDSTFNSPPTGFNFQIPGGNYSISVTDFINNSNSLSFTNYIPYSPIKIDSIATRSPTCRTSSDGTITAYISGGTPPYRFEWISAAGQKVLVGDNVYGALTYGDFQLKVTDAVGCDTLETVVTLDAPPQIEIQFQKIKDVSCFDGTSDGEVQASAAYKDGSLGTFIYYWQSTSQLEENVSTTTGINLSKGWQTLVATDQNNNCYGLDSVEIKAPLPITISPNTTRTRCNGSQDGILELNTSGGIGTYSFNWKHDANLTTPVANSLTSGYYTVTVTDANLCPQIDSFFVPSPDPLTIQIDSTNTAPVSCFGESDGFLTVTYNSEDDINTVGNAPFQWQDNIASSIESTATQLKAGTYGVTLTDTKGCKDSISVLIAEPGPLVANFQIPSPPLCYGEPTIFSVDNITGGNGQKLSDFQFLLDSSNISYRADQNASIFAGQHRLKVIDQKNCTYIDSFFINSPDPTEVAFDPSNIVIKLGDENQKLEPIINYSTPIASFTWTPEAFLDEPNSLNPMVTATDDQVFSLEIADINGCISRASITVAIDKNRLVYIPNVFSPNNDGVNDFFTLNACAGVQSISSIRIFDRWGKIVALSEEAITPNCMGGTLLWDGVGAKEGTYIYSILVTFVDGLTLNYRGSVSLVK